MNGIHHAVHIEKQMISERYVLLSRPERCSRSKVFAVLHNKVPASEIHFVGVSQVTGTLCRGERSDRNRYGLRAGNRV